MLTNSLSHDGYIIDQSKVRGLDNGVYDSWKNGCGWIAVWNFLKYHGRDPDYREIHGYFLKHLRFGGLLGTKPTAVFAYLRSLGFNVTRVLTKKKALLLSQKINSGIVMYVHNRGAHFVAFYRENDEEFRFLNAVYGREAHIMPMDEFFRDHSYINLMYFIGLE